MQNEHDFADLRDTLFDPVPAEEAAAALGDINSAGLIVVTQLPEITQRLHLVKAQIEQTVADALSLEVTEDNRQAAKNQLAAMRKGIKALEEQRLAVRRVVLAPYEEMEAVYRACVTDVWKPAEAQLSGRIVEIENGLIGEKRAEVETYFTELCAAHGLDFLRLEDSGVKVNLSATVKAGKAQCKAFVDRVMEDLDTISLHEYRAEILVEYRCNGFNQQRATIDVCHRVDAANAERARQEQLAAQREAEAAAMERIDEAAEAFAPPVQEVMAVDMAPANEDQTPIHISFAFDCSPEQLAKIKPELIALREKLKKVGINYGK
jgi:hypothetical protein